MKHFTATWLILLLLLASPAAGQRPQPKPTTPPPTEDEADEEMVTVPPELVKQLTEAATKDCPDFKKDDGARKFAQSLQASALDLNEDGEPELVISLANECYCGISGGNCATRVYQKTPQGYALILDAGGVLKLEAKDTVSRGYFDVRTDAHSSATDTFITTYRWDGQRYQPVDCEIRRFVRNQRGRAIYRTIREKCPAGIG